MKFTVFGYNFPHWKTQQGLLNLVCNSFVPDIVVLQDRKELNIPRSKPIHPEGEYLQNPQDVCAVLGIPFVVQDHDDYDNTLKSELGVILGARILKKKTIERYSAVLNIHPGILPGNRGLDNLKWSLIKDLPIGVTAHFIDERVDMGEILFTKEMKDRTGTLKEIYFRHRDLEQKALIDAMTTIYNRMTWTTPCTFTPKFSAVPEELDRW